MSHTHDGARTEAGELLDAVEALRSAASRGRSLGGNALSISQTQVEMSVQLCGSSAADGNRGAVRWWHRRSQLRMRWRLSLVVVHESILVTGETEGGDERRGDWVVARN